MHFLAVSLRKDWARTVRDPAQFAISLGIPLVLGILMSVVFGRAPAAPHGLLLVADEDHSIASTRFLDGFHRDPLDKMIAVENVTRAVGRARIERGDASAFLLLPKGLQLAFLTNAPCRLELYTNPAESILPQMIRETMLITIDAASYFRRGGTPLIEVENVAVRPSRPARSFASIFLPSMLFMSLLFLATSSAVDIWKERMQGTLRRTAVSPVSMLSYLSARVIFIILTYAMVSLVGLEAAQRLAGMPVPNLPAAALWMTFVGTVFYLLFLWITMLATTQRAASVLTNLVIFPLAMIGGCFFPFEWMPNWMVSVGRLTPNGWALLVFKAILDNAAHAGQVARSAAALAAFAALAFVFILRRARGFAV
jgi:ABC-2 type transport system permease protein